MAAKFKDFFTHSKMVSSMLHVFLYLLLPAKKTRRIASVKGAAKRHKSADQSGNS